MLSRFDDAQQLRLLGAMHTIAELLDDQSGMKYAQPFVPRSHRPGDMAWITRRRLPQDALVDHRPAKKCAPYLPGQGLCAGVANAGAGVWPADGR